MALTKERLKEIQKSMVERKEPKFITIAEGEIVSGILHKIEPNTEIKEKDSGRSSKVTRYTLETDEGEMVQFLGTYQIDSKIRLTDVFHYVAIRNEGEDKNVVRNGNAMKVFKIAVSPSRVVGNVHGLEIGDEDLPPFMKS